MVAVSSGVKPFRLANVRGLGPHVLVVIYRGYPTKNPTKNREGGLYNYTDIFFSIAKKCKQKKLWNGVTKATFSFFFLGGSEILISIFMGIL